MNPTQDKLYIHGELKAKLSFKIPDITGS